MVSFAAGGLTDVPARMLAPEMQQRLGQPVVVENKPGASGVTGGSYVVRAAADGYTLLVSGISEVQNFYYIHVPYDVLTDLSPVGKIADGPPLVLVVNGKSPFKNVADLLAYAKANPTTMNFATTGPATSPAIAVSQLNALAGTQIIAVPYNGSGPAATAVVSGEVQAGFVFYPSAAGMVDSGQMRVLAVASSHRLQNLADVPTMEDLGFRNFQHDAFVGLLAPRDTPASVIGVLNKALNEFDRRACIPQATRTIWNDTAATAQYPRSLWPLHGQAGRQSGRARQASRPPAAKSLNSSGGAITPLSRFREQDERAGASPALRNDVSQ